MSILVVDQGESIALQALLNKLAPQDLDLILYTNNKTPAETDTEAGYTEASGFGYSRVLLTAASWVISGSAPTDAAYPEQTFTFTGALGNVYGYALYQRTSGKLVFAERFSNGPYNVQNNGDQIKVTPHITAD